MVINIWNNDETLAAFVDNWTSAVHTEEINGINSLTVSLPVVNENLIEGNYLGFYDVDDAYQMFEIIEVEETHDGVEVYAEHVICELNSDIVEDARPYNQTAETALGSALTDTRWITGTVADLGLNSTNFYFESARSAIAKIVNTWGGELKYRLVFSGNEITHRYVDLLEARGSVTGKRFEYKKDIVSIRRTVSMDGVFTACYGRGKGEEVGTNDDGKTTYGKRLSFADEVWTTPTNPVNKPLNQKWVGDDTAKALFGYGTRHRMGVFLDDEETDAASLLQKTWDYLQANKTPKATYDMDVLVLETLSGYAHEKVRLGDTVVINDSELGIALTARVIRIEADLLNPEKSKIRLGNYIDGLTGTVYEKLSFVDRYRDRQGFYDDGSARAKEGLDESGYVDLPIYGQNIVGTTAEDGLNMTNTHMGYYNDAQSAWRAYIDNQGNFLFQKDANNYFKFDGTNFTFRGPLVADDTTSGMLKSPDGSTYFDLDNAEIVATDGTNKLVLDETGLHGYVSDVLRVEVEYDRLEFHRAGSSVGNIRSEYISDAWRGSVLGDCLFVEAAGNSIAFNAASGSTAPSLVVAPTWAEIPNFITETIGIGVSDTPPWYMETQNTDADFVIGGTYGDHLSINDYTGQITIGGDVDINGSIVGSKRKVIYLTTGDCDTITEEWVVTHPDVLNTPLPGTTYWYIQTILMNTGNNRQQIAYRYNGFDIYRRRYDGDWSGWTKIWTGSTDGSGSWLDADLLDGYHASSFPRIIATTTYNYQISNLAPNDYTSFTLSVSGVADYDQVLVAVPGIVSGDFVIRGNASSGAVTIVITNVSNSTKSTNSFTYKIMVLR